MSIWQPIADPSAGFIFRLSDSLRILENNNTGLLASVANGSLFVASDYSGQHKGATHESYSFLITTDQALGGWLPSLRDFRQRWLPDDRRISFKKLNEPVRWRALPAFLETVSELSGNLVTIMIDRNVGSFMHGGPDATIAAFPDCFPLQANRGTVEKMLRLASLLALILSGFRNEDQDSILISDHDEALDSHDKRECFARLATYITYGLTRWQKPAGHYFSTTELPFVPAWSEDVAAVPDLVAGAYCHMSGHLPAFLGREVWQLKVASRGYGNKRAHAICEWLASSRGALRHVLLRLEQDAMGEVRASAQAFRPRQNSL
ncbi:hypothetical protein [Nitrospirillum amazonense]|nr:hypothetical protein [Nitrospirillum amazonense]